MFSIFKCLLFLFFISANLLNISCSNFTLFAQQTVLFHKFSFVPANFLFSAGLRPGCYVQNSLVVFSRISFFDTPSPHSTVLYAEGKPSGTTRFLRNCLAASKACQGWGPSGPCSCLRQAGILPGPRREGGGQQAGSFPPTPLRGGVCCYGGATLLTTASLCVRSTQVFRSSRPVCRSLIWGLAAPHASFAGSGPSGQAGFAGCCSCRAVFYGV